MSYNIYAPLAAFLPGDLRTRVNAEVTGSPLVAGSVIVSRTPQTDAPRDHNAPALTVELVPLPAQRGATLGIGYVEELIAFLAFVTRKRKDTREGADQLSDVEAITRAIAHSYDGVSDITVTSLPAGITLASIRAQARGLDETTNREMSRATAELLFTFVRPMEAQA